MRIFLTGATGYIGSAVFDALVRAGHRVTALVRNPAKARRIQSAGGESIVGALNEPSSFAGAAVGFDGYIHAAFDSQRRGEADLQTIQALRAAACTTARSRTSGPRPFVIYTSGVWVLGQQLEPADETAPVNPIPLVAYRPDSERCALAAAEDGVRAIVVRPGIVYGERRGIVSEIVREANNGLIRVIGEGSNHWPLVYQRDLADLYVLLAQRSDAEGIYHANDEGDERVADVVEAIQSHSSIKSDVRRMPLGEARKKMGAYADALALDQKVRSPRARALGWSPTVHSVSDSVSRLLEEWRTPDE